MSRRLAVAVALVLALAGCGGGEPGETADEDRPVTVFAAASLEPTFTSLGARFRERTQAARPGFSFAGSADLASQIRAGAPADVVATADAATMDALADEGLVGSSRVFATNRLEIVTPPGNPAGVESFADLAREDLAVVLCAPEVPCGSAAVELEEVTGVDISPVSEEQSVTDVLGKVRSGEADAGLVYVTDVKAAGTAVTGVPFPESRQVVNEYLIAPVRGGTSGLAVPFVEFVLSPDSQRLLRDAGFGAP